MKKRILLILALVMVVITVVAGLAGCKEEILDVDFTQLYNFTSSPVTLVDKDATSSLQGYTFTGEGFSDLRSFIATTTVVTPPATAGGQETIETTLHIIYVNDDGTVKKTSIGLDDKYAITPITANGLRYYRVFNNTEDLAKPYTMYDIYGTAIISYAEVDNIVTRNIGDDSRLYFYDNTIGNLYAMDKITYAITKVETGGVQYNVVAAGSEFLNIPTDATVSDHCYFVERDKGFIVYNKSFVKVKNVQCNFAKYEEYEVFFLENDDILLQGLVNKPSDAKRYDIYDSSDDKKQDVETLLYTMSTGEWTEVKDLNDYHITEVIPVYDDAKDTIKCNNIVILNAIEDKQINESKTIFATMTNEGVVENFIFSSDEYLFTGEVDKKGDLMYFGFVDVMGDHYYKVYKGTELVRTFNKNEIDGEDLGQNYYVSQRYIRSYIDVNFKLEILDKQRVSGSLFTTDDAEGTRYYVFDESLKAFRELLPENTNKFFLNVTANSELIIYTYTDGTKTVLDNSGRVILANANYNFNDTIWYTKQDGKQSIATARVLFVLG